MYYEEQNTLKAKVCILENKIAAMINKDSNENSRFEKLEIVIKAMTRKVLSLENEIEKMKTKEEQKGHRSSKYSEASNKLENVEANKNERELETKKEASNTKPFTKIEEHDNKVQDQIKASKTKDVQGFVFKFGAEAHKSVLERKDDQEVLKMSTDLKCDQCNCKAQKLNTLRKHKKSKHTEQKCKVCEKIFKTSMDLVSHVANEHIEEEEWKVKAQSTPNSDGEVKLSSFVSSESLLDEFS